jgi:hypothetical protein
MLWLDGRGAAFGFLSLWCECVVVQLFLLSDLSQKEFNISSCTAFDGQSSVR